MKKILTLLALFFLVAAPLVSVAQKFPGLDEKNATLEPQAEATPSQQPPVSQPAQQTQPAGQTQSNSPNAYSFVPLTNLPGIDQSASSDTLPSFFNNLYKLCIGAAAVIAILKIMGASFYFMFNKGSVAHNEKGKTIIMNSVLGLLLVLSPAIVFGIINPDILNLRLDLGRLNPGTLEQINLQNDSLARECNITQAITSAQRNCWDQSNTAVSTAYARCLDAGTAAQTCRTQAQATARSGAMGCLPMLTSEQLQCVIGRSLNYAERPQPDSQNRNSRCELFGQPQSVSATGSCSSLGSDYTLISSSCCRSFEPGGLCCARPRAAVDQTGDQWMWRVMVRRSSVGGTFGSTEEPRQGGPFASQRECENSYAAFTLSNTPTSVQCTCSQTKNAQPACRNL